TGRAARAGNPARRDVALPWSSRRTRFGAMEFLPVRNHRRRSFLRPLRISDHGNPAAKCRSSELLFDILSATKLSNSADLLRHGGDLSHRPPDRPPGRTVRRRRALVELYPRRTEFLDDHSSDVRRHMAGRHLVIGGGGAVLSSVPAASLLPFAAHA